MKRKKFMLLLAVISVLLFCVPAYADAQLGYVTDAAQLLSDEEWEALETKAEQIAAEYNCGVYIITVDDFTRYAENREVYEATKEIYREYELGIGEDQSGLLLLLSMAERDYALIAKGYGNTAFTDYGKDYLSKRFLDDFRDDNWYQGFSDYLSCSGEMLQSAAAGTPLDIGTNAPVIDYSEAPYYGVWVCLLIGLLTAFIVTRVLRSQMRSVEIKSEAFGYSADGLILTAQEDRFTHTTESRVYEKPKEAKSSGGTTIDSDGFSGKSGKF